VCGVGRGKLDLTIVFSVLWAIRGHAGDKFTPATGQAVHPGTRTIFNACPHVTRMGGRSAPLNTA
jgi:hypothetical protein